MRCISRISIAAVKGFRLLHPERVELTEQGVVENRRFLIVGEDGRHLRSEPTTWAALVSSVYDPAQEALRMTFPDGATVEASALAHGETVVTHIEPGARRVEMRVVDGPWTEPLSRIAGRAVRLARPEHPGAPLTEPVTLMSESSIGRLAREAGRPVDGRRFRMLFTLAGCTEHEEDTWDGRLVRAGDAVLRITGPVDRCVVTTRDPDTGERDLDTLRLIKGYRGMRDRYIDFGMFAQVEKPGAVALGDAVEPLAGS
jgi:uncharacterized protein YcbX